MTRDEQTSIIVRDFDAPAHLLFECYSDPKHMKKFFGPGDYPLVECDMDFRVGGRIEMAMRGPDGTIGPRFGGEYVAIEPNRKIAYTNQFLDERGREDPMLVTLTFEDLGGRTKLTVETRFSSVAQAQRHLGMGYEGGVGVGLDQLAAYLRDL